MGKPRDAGPQPPAPSQTHKAEDDTHSLALGLGLLWFRVWFFFIFLDEERNN